MMPSNARLNGPVSSFQTNQDRLALTAGIHTVANQINVMTRIYDPESLDLIPPVLPTTLTLPVSAATALFNGAPVDIPATTLTLTASAVNYLDLAASGWYLTVAGTAAPEPALPEGARRVAAIYVAAAPLALVDMTSNHLLATRLAAVRDSLNLLAEAYL